MGDPMPYPGSEQTRLEWRAEHAQLRRSEADIAAGRLRLRNRERLILPSKELGSPIDEAERLAALLRGILMEWERHRTFFVQPLAYLAARPGEEPTRP
jgi:hypothetical protein